MSKKQPAKRRATSASTAPRGRAADTADGSATGNSPDTAEIAATLKRVHKPLRLDDFLRVFGLPRRAKKNLEATLHAMADAGTLLRVAGGAYCLASTLKEMTGTLHVQRSGVGFVLPDSSPGTPGGAPAKTDVFISPQYLGDAWHGDRVAVTLFPGQRGKNRDGRITRVLERARKELVVRVVRVSPGEEAYCDPTDAQMTAAFLVDISALPEKPGRDSLLRIRPGERKGPDLWQGTALACLGDENVPQVQEELVKAGHAIPRVFPPDAVQEAAMLPKEPDERSMAGRRDLSHIPFVTIDGETARDFDDAVHVEKEGRSFTLRVAIADVAHYVRPGSALDTEALARGNSYYFPRSVEPMLPEALSNGLCSLNPQVPRLVMVAEMTFDSQGNPGKEDFYSGLIRSSARLTYDGVRDALLPEPAGKKPTFSAPTAVIPHTGFQGAKPLGGDSHGTESLGPPKASHIAPSPSSFSVPSANVPMLQAALELARILAAVRRERGSLDFDLPEPQCLFDADGNISAIVPRENHFIHKLIEVFMVAANEAVARFLTAKGRPVLYRAHPAPDPDKLKNLFNLLAASGLVPAGARAARKETPSPKELQSVLNSVKGTPAEYLISRVALRTMMQAGYTQDLEGHFGLASDCYCHFTSPIRRYADLVVHRSLKAALDAPDAAGVPGRGKLQEIADHINATERTAMAAERELFRRLGVLYMQNKIDEEFDGVISGLTEFGIFVELAGPMTEGMIRLMTLGDDYYIYYPDRHELRGERGGKIFRLGQSVRVRVTDVNLARQEINLIFVGEHASPRRRDSNAKRKNDSRRGKPTARTNDRSESATGRPRASASKGRSQGKGRKRG